MLCTFQIPESGPFSQNPRKAIPTLVLFSFVVSLQQNATMMSVIGNYWQSKRHWRNRQIRWRGLSICLSYGQITRTLHTSKQPSEWNPGKSGGSFFLLALTLWSPRAPALTTSNLMPCHDNSPRLTPPQKNPPPASYPYTWFTYLEDWGPGLELVLTTCFGFIESRWILFQVRVLN